jgi:hypothetical protein
MKKDFADVVCEETVEVTATFLPSGIRVIRSASA